MKCTLTIGGVFDHFSNCRLFLCITDDEQMSIFMQSTTFSSSIDPVQVTIDHFVAAVHWWLIRKASRTLCTERCRVSSQLSISHWICMRWHWQWRMQYMRGENDKQLKQYSDRCCYIPFRYCQFLAADPRTPANSVQVDCLSDNHPSYR